MTSPHLLPRLESLAAIYRPAAPSNPVLEMMRLIANFEHERRGMMSDETEQFLTDLSAQLKEMRELEMTRGDLIETVEAETKHTKERMGEDLDEASIEAKQRLYQDWDALHARSTKLTREACLIEALEKAKASVSTMASQLREAMIDRLDNLAGDLKGRIER